MNNKAEELGLSGTHYMNVHGLHDEEHYTTAADLCTLSREAMKNKTFRSIVAMSQANIPATDKVRARTLINTNGLLSTLKYPNYFLPVCDRYKDRAHEPGWVLFGVFGAERRS